MQQELEGYLDGLGIAREQPILVAVSGGMDSMVLLHLLQRMGQAVAVAHFNYGLRGEESDGDERLVADYCSLHRLPFHLRSSEGKGGLPRGESVQMAARGLRYAFFTALMKEHGYPFTALAHHADDRLESLMLHILRGTGIRGFCGIPRERGRYIRPLLPHRRQAIAEWAAANGVVFREDSSNLSTHYRRNWVRLRLIPMLRAASPNAENTLLGFASRAEDTVPAYFQWVGEHAGGVCRDADGVVTIPLDDILSSSFPFTLLRELTRPFGLSPAQVLELLRNAPDGRADVQSRTHRAVMGGGEITVVGKQRVPRVPRLLTDIVQRAELPNLRVASDTLLLDADRVDPKRLVVRRARTGDRFRPFGMEGSKLVSDLLIDLKWSALEKEEVFVLEYEGEILWVIGLRSSACFPVAAETVRVLRLRAVDVR